MYQVPFTPAAMVSFCTSYGDLENVFARPVCFRSLQCCRPVPAEFLFGDTMRIFGTTEKVLPPSKSCPRDFLGGGGPSHAQTTVCKPRNAIRLPPRQVCQEQPLPGSFPLGIPKRGRGRRAAMSACTRRHISPTAASSSNSLIYLSSHSPSAPSCFLQIKTPHKFQSA